MAWTEVAIDAGLRTRIGSHETVEQLFQEGLLVNADQTGPSQDDRSSPACGRSARTSTAR